MDLFYFENIKSTSRNFVLDKEESHHIYKVLRKKIGDEIFITDGEGGLYKCEIKDFVKQRASCVIKEEIKFEFPKNKIIAIIPLLKIPSRFDLMIEKLVELGVLEFFPYISKNTAVKEKGHYERWEKLIVSSMKQSKKYFKPRLNKIMNLLDILNLEYSKNSIKLFGDLETEVKPEKKLSDYSEIIFCVGPEGDFTKEEKEEMRNKDFIPISLGKNILRSETAAISFAAIINSLI